MGKTDQLIINGTVTEAFANARFRVRLETGQEIQAYLSGQIRRFRIRVTQGDTVRVELSPYDLTRGRIVYRER